jgi:hypothetical protein
VIPLYTLRSSTIQFRDIYFTFFLFVSFILWLHLNHQSLRGNLKLIYNSLLFGENKTPFMAFLSREFVENIRRL